MASAPFFKFPRRGCSSFLILPTQQVHYSGLPPSPESFHEDYWKVSFLFHCGMKIKCQDHDSWGALGFSFPFNGMRLLVLICFHALKQQLNSNWHYWEGDNCSLGINSLGPATCPARKPHQVGFTSFKCHYSMDLLNLCTPKLERHHREWKDGWQAWMNALVRFSILDCHAFPGPDANI